MPLEPGQPLGELDLDALDRGVHPLLGGHVVRRGEQHQPVELLDDLTGERVHRRDALHLVAEELHPNRPFLVGREHLDGVAPDPELVAGERHVVALVLQLHEARQHCPLVAFLTPVQDQALPLVFGGGTKAVDRRHRRDDDHVAARHERARRRVAQPVDLVVDRRVLLDVGVGRGEVRLGLVVVVIGDEVLDPVLREELPELRRELCRETLVGGQDQRRALHPGDDRGDRERLARPGDPEEGLEPLPRVDALGERVDRRRLVSGRGELGDELDGGHQPMVSVGCDATGQPGSRLPAPGAAPSSRRRSRSCHTASTWGSSAARSPPLSMR